MEEQGEQLRYMPRDDAARDISLEARPRCGVDRHHPGLPQIMTKSFTVALGGRQFLDVKNVLYRGPRDIYLGVIGSMVSTLGVGVLYFGTYQAFKATADEHLASTRFASLSHVMAASTGAVVSALVRVPGDTLKHRVQAYFHPNCWAALQAIVREEGVAGLYKGFSATLIRDVPEIAIQFTAYEAFRRAVVRRRGEEKLPTYEHLLLGGAAGALAASCTMPLDYIKTVVQCGRPEPIFQVLQNTLAAEGPRGLFKGMGPRVLMTTTMSAAFFGLFEFWKQVRADWGVVWVWQGMCMGRSVAGYVRGAWCDEHCVWWLPTSSCLSRRSSNRPSFEKEATRPSCRRSWGRRGTRCGTAAARACLRCERACSSSAGATPAIASACPQR